MHLCFQREGDRTLKKFSLCENYTEQHTFVDNFYSIHGLYKVPAMYQAFLGIQSMFLNSNKCYRCCYRWHNTRAQPEHKGGVDDAYMRDWGHTKFQ